MIGDIPEEATTMLAALALGAKGGHMTIDEVVSRAFLAGVSAGRVQGLQQARSIIAGEAP